MTEPLPMTLTPRERQVIEGVIAGRSCAEMAAQLGIRPITVRKTLERAYNRLGINRREVLACYGPLLSETEMWISRLVAEALPDRQIAERMGMTVSNVDKHLLRIRAKLCVPCGVNARVWLARWVWERDAEREAA